jgi:hypothetical protein
LTQLKYAMIMFGPSLKSVPGCLVSIVPSLIGVPVAFTPGLGPHVEVLVEPPLALEPLDELEPPLAAALLVELLLLPHPARIAIPTIATANTTVSRIRGTYSRLHTDLSSSSDPGLNPAPVGRGEAGY